MSLSSKVLKSSILLLFMRVFMRGIGIFSMLALARLLSTEDFGVVAIATSVVFLFDILSETGSQQYLIQKSKISDDDLNTCWTINLILKLIVWVLFVLLTPFIADFFESEALVMPFYVISSVILLSGFFNPGIYLYQREFNFNPLVKMSITEKLVSFFVTILLAFLYQSYWAMIAGVVTTYTIKLVYSYKLHEFRPKWSLKNAKEQWDFSKWMLLRGVMGYTRAEFDTAFVSKTFGLPSVGGYNLMKNLSLIPAQDIIAPATQPLLTSFSKVQNSKPDMIYQISLSLVIISVVAFPIVSFLGFNDKLVVEVMFGEKWVEFSVILKYLAVLIISFSWVSILNHALTSIGKVNLLFGYDFVSMLLLIGILLSLNYTDLHEFAFYRAGIGVLSAFLFMMFVFRLFSINLLKVLWLVLPFGLASLAAGWLSMLLVESLGYNIYFELIVGGIAFSLSYLIVFGAILSAFKNNPEYSHVRNIIQREFEKVRAKVFT